jgi:hypothetical protein
MIWSSFFTEGCFEWRMQNAAQHLIDLKERVFRIYHAVQGDTHGPNIILHALVRFPYIYIYKYIVEKMKIN